MTDEQSFDLRAGRVAREELGKNTEVLKKAGGAVSRYMFVSPMDPQKATIVTFWKDKQAMEKGWATVRAYSAAKNPPAGPSPWAKVERNEYDVVQLI